MKSRKPSREAEGRRLGVKRVEAWRHDPRGGQRFAGIIFGPAAGAGAEQGPARKGAHSGAGRHQLAQAVVSPVEHPQQRKTNHHEVAGLHVAQPEREEVFVLV
jgi:hypothetical protein